MALAVYSSQVQDQNGNAISGAQVTVYSVVSNARVLNPLPSVYASSDSDAASPVAILNPLTTDTVGRFGFSAPDGPYDVVVSGGTSYAGYSQRVRIVSASATGAGSGSVTSVALSLPAQFSVSGSPVTGAGTLTAGWANQTANTFFTGPATGAATVPTFRALVTADLPASGVTAGAYGSVVGVTVTVPVVTVDVTGRVTALTTAVATLPVLPSGVTVGTFGGITGSTITVPVVTTNATGSITTISTAVVTVPVVTVVNNWAKAQTAIVVSPAFGATVTIDASLSNLVSLIATSNFTLATPVNAPSSPYGMTMQAKITQNGVGGWLITYGSGIKFPVGFVTTLSTAPNATDIITLTFYPDTGFWYGTLLKGFS